MQKLTAQYIVDILSKQMDMPANSVWIRDQNRLIPNDNGLYIIVGMISSFPTANVVSMIEKIVDDVPTQYQLSELQTTENIQIDVLSRSNDALTRTWEVIAAIQSFYAQGVQETNNFKIFSIPGTFLNTSSAEGGSQLNRYTIQVRCAVWYRKEELLAAAHADYYDDFSTRVDTAETIDTDTPIIEFEINSEGIVP